MIIAKLDVTKIDKKYLFPGKKGTYLDIVLMENRDGPDQYGNDYMVVQGISKEARAAGEKGPILGNAKIIESQRKQRAPEPRPEPNQAQDSDDIPF